MTALAGAAVLIVGSLLTMWADQRVMKENITRLQNDTNETSKILIELYRLLPGLRMPR